MSINYVPRTWVTGEVVTAAYMNNEIGVPFTGIQAAWTSYSPALTASTTNPTGYTANGRYLQIGKFISVRVQIIMGAAAGTGSYAVSLPTAADSAMSATFRSAGSGWLGRGGSIYPILFGVVAGTSAAQLYYISSVGGASVSAVTNTAPLTLTTADTLNIGPLIYEAA